MRVLVALGFTLALAAPAARAQIATVTEEIANGNVPVLTGGKVDAERSTAATVRDETNRGGEATHAERPAVNGMARSLMDGGLHGMARERLEESVRRGEADAETHYLLAEAKLAEAKALRAAADVAAANGDAAYAARLRTDADARIREGLDSLRQGEAHALRVAEERLASGDLDGAANVANALRHVDPNHTRANEILAAATARRDAASAAAATTGAASTGAAGTGAASTGAAAETRTAAAPAGDASSRSVWDRYGSDQSSVWDRAVANANRTTTPTASTTPTTSTGTTPSTTSTSTGSTSTPATGSEPVSTTPATADSGEPITTTATNRLGRPMQVSQADLEVLARIVKGEALVCSFEGKVAVAAVVLNRVRDSRWPNTIPGVAHQPLQFSCYNRNYRQQLYYGPVPEECFRAARAALAGQDPTGGATHYYNPYLVQPDWARRLTLTRRIGTNRNDTHVFYR